MLLIRRSQRASNAVRTVSPGGELFVASVVVCMLLAAFGDAVDPVLFGESSLEAFLLDFGGEFSVMALRHLDMLQLLMAGGLLAAGITVLRVTTAPFFQTTRPGPAQPVDKVPIKL